MVWYYGTFNPPISVYDCTPESITGFENKVLTNVSGIHEDGKRDADVQGINL